MFVPWQSFGIHEIPSVKRVECYVQTDDKLRKKNECSEIRDVPSMPDPVHFSSFARGRDNRTCADQSKVVMAV